MNEEKEGVWRTIRGRRIFIEKGVNLKEAMKKSGKFKHTLTAKEKEEKTKLEQEYSKREYWKAQKEAHDLYAWKEHTADWRQRNAMYDVRKRYAIEKQEYADKEFEKAYKKAQKMSLKELRDYFKNNK